MSKVRHSGRRSRPLAGAAIALIGAAGLAFRAAPLTPGHTLVDWIGVTVLYVPLSMALVFQFRVLARRGLVARIVSALVFGAVLLFFLRPQTDLVHLASRPGQSLLLLLLASVGPLAFPPPRRGSRWDLGVLVGSVVALPVLLLFVATGEGSLRWHMFNHQPFLGLFAHQLTGASSADSPERLLESQGLPAGEPETPGLSIPDGAGERPTLVLIMIDTLRADSLSAYGAAAPAMPHLERFAVGGTVFADVRTNATWSLPSVASWFTGKLSEQVGVFDEGDVLPESATTLAERMKALGYATTAFTTNPYVSRKYGFAQGFDVFEQLWEKSSNSRAESVVAAVESWLSGRVRRDQPEFLYVHFMDPHTPYQTTPPGNPLLGQYSRAAYRAELEYLDHHLGSLLETLTSALPQHAAILVTSDHGEEFGEHGKYGHGQSVYPELTAVPAILRWNAETEESIATPLEARDFFGLFAGLAQGEVSSLSAWAASRRRASRYVSSYKTPRSRLVRALSPHEVIRIRGVQTGTRLRVWNGFGPILEEYDLQADPNAYRTLITGGAADGLLGRLNSMVEFWVSPEAGTIDKADEKTLRSLGYL